MLTLAGAGASLIVMLLVLGEPALRACVPNERGMFACLREAAVERLNLPVDTVAETSEVVARDTPAPSAPEPMPPATPVVAYTPAPAMPEAAEVDLVAEPGPATEHGPVVEPEPKPLVTAAIGPETPREPYQPTPGKLERTPVTALPDNISAPTAPEVLPTPLPAETGSIETPVAPAVEALVEPGNIALPQLPPPPLAQEFSQSPAAPAEPAAAPQAETAPLPEPARLADQPLPGSAVPPAAGPIPSPLAEAPADSAAAAATAIADPVLPPLPAAPSPASSPVPVKPTSTPVAEASPIPPEPVPDVAATPAADPTIDTIAFDETGTVVAGDGPQGAVIHLYVDAEPAGEGPVLDGRWEVFGAPLFAAPAQTLRAVAVDPETGRVLGETEISIELELPESTVPPMVDEIAPQRPDPDRIADAASVPETPTPELPDANLTADLTGGPATTAPRQVAAPVAATPKALPPLRTVVPRGETSSVTILPDSRSRIVERPGSGFAILGD